MALPTLTDYPERYDFHFCPRCGTPLATVLLHGMDRRRCPACRWVHFALPNVAATVVIPYQGGIVLVQRDIEPDLGIWHLPIGHAEYGEDPADTALREGEEETGLKLAQPRFLGYTHGPSYGDPRLFYLVFGFSAHVVGGALTGSDEGRNVRVAPLDQMEPLKWTSQQAAVEAFRDLTR
ncbi:MAG: NUDIX hydrolase [Oscillochloris sp.]|nr:NUDIX hydrolase [Oscillochloris sp.]